MNRQMLQSLASDWTRMAKNDIRTKIIEFMNEVDTTPQELAYALAISDGELQQILEGNGEITLSTFAKLLIATGNALEIKPIEQTPIGNYHNTRCVDDLPPIPNMPPLARMTRPRPAVRTEQRNNVFNRERSQQHPIGNQETQRILFGHDMPIMPPIFNHEEEEPRIEHTKQPRDAHGRFQRREQPQVPQSKFASMTRQKLIEIIKNHLWDSEIDVNSVTFSNLVKFLEEKDKKFNEMKKIREAEQDPKVFEFKNRIKNSLKTNPHLRDYLKNILGEI